MSSSKCLCVGLHGAELGCPPPLLPDRLPGRAAGAPQAEANFRGQLARGGSMRSGVELCRGQLGSPSFGEFQPHTSLVTVVVCHHGDADQQEAEGASWRECGQAMAEPVVSGRLEKRGMDGLTGFLTLVLQFVADGVFYAELNELLTRELAEDGYSGVEVRVTPLRTQIIIRATRTQGVLGEQRGDLAGRWGTVALAQRGRAWFSVGAFRPGPPPHPRLSCTTGRRLAPGPIRGGLFCQALRRRILPGAGRDWESPDGRQWQL